MTAGRPTKYNPQYIKKVDEYLKLCTDKEYNFHETRGKKIDVYKERLKVKLPTIEGFALYLGIERKTLYNWADTHSNFQKTLEKIKSIQLERLINQGLAGNYSPVIAKLILSSNHGMKEKSDVTSNDKPIPLFDYTSSKKKE